MCYSSVRPSIHQATPIYNLESILAHEIYEREWKTLIYSLKDEFYLADNYFVKLKLKDLKLFIFLIGAIIYASLVTPVISNHKIN
jgi:hypothetical protein